MPPVPLHASVGALVDIDLPLFSERHLKVAFDDSLGAVPRSAGLVICEDPIALAWSTADERIELAEAPTPVGSRSSCLPAFTCAPRATAPTARRSCCLWAYHVQPHPEILPVPMEQEFTEVALRGMARLVPGLLPYTQKLPKAYMDGGYYTKTAENRPLIGPLPPPGAYVTAGLSGFGLMAACAAAELLAAHVTAKPLPSYAPAFALERYANAGYVARMADWGSKGQL